MEVLKINKVSLSMRRLKQLKTLLRALSNDWNTKLLNVIDEYREPTVADLYKEMKTSQAYVSQKLSFFRENDIVYYSQFGKKHKYFINALRIKQLDNLMRRFGVFHWTGVDNYRIFYDMITTIENPFRAKILQYLIDSGVPKAVNEIARHFDWPQSQTSAHLGKLRAFNLVTTDRQSKNIYYYPNLVALTSIIAGVNTFYTQKAASIII